MSKSPIRDQELLEARCIAVVERIAEELDLGWLKIVNSFDPRNSEDRVVCECKSDWEYRQCSLLWNLHQVASTTDEDLEEIAVHELVHGLNDPVWGSLSGAQQEKLGRLNELATENVARVILHLLKK
jgi:hypothetical protein